MAQRVKGIECKLALSTPDGANEDVFDDVLEAELTIRMDILEQMYLGKTAPEFDDIFKGIEGNVKFHMEGSTYIGLTEKIQDRAERRTPADGVFNLTFTVNFPSGAKARLTCENIFFGDMPIRIPKAEEYVEGALDFKCSTLRRII